MTKAQARSIPPTVKEPNAPDAALVCIKSVRRGERVSSHYLHYCAIAELQQKSDEIKRDGFCITSVSRVPGGDGV
jgi:hypothetical protein